MQSFICLEYTGESRYLWIHRRQTYYSNASDFSQGRMLYQFVPWFRISFQMGLGAACLLEAVLRDLFWSCIYIARNKYLYRLTVYFRKIWRMLVEAVSEQKPPIPPLSLSPALSFGVPSLLNASSVMPWAQAYLLPAKAPNEQATNRPPEAGRPGEVVAGAQETQAPHNMAPQSELISCSNLCFLQASATSTPRNTVMCLLRKGNQRSAINRLD